MTRLLTLTRLLTGLPLVFTCAVSAATLQLSAPVVWLAETGGHVYGVNGRAELLRTEGRRVTVLSRSFSSHFIAACAGRVVGVNDAGQLQIWMGGKSEPTTVRGLSPLARPLCLPSGIIAAAKSGDLVRFEPASGIWNETARTPARALPDAQLTLADLTGRGEAQVVVLSGPDAQRSDHGVLGDALEATGISVFDQQTLQLRAQLTLPAPFVFEDLQARPVRDADGRDVLVVVRSSAAGGAALTMVEHQGQSLQFRATGPDFGQGHRWLAPIVGFGQLWAVQTPHIGGHLVQYQELGRELKGTERQAGVSNHQIGSRNLQAAALIAPGRLLVPADDHRSLQLLECAGRCRVTAEFRLSARYSSNVLVTGGKAWIADDAGLLHTWELGAP